MLPRLPPRSTPRGEPPVPLFERHTRSATDRIVFSPEVLIMAGWTGRDEASLRHHIEELAALGVPGPSRVPLFYRLDPSLLTGPVEAIEVLGEDTSGEVEAVLVALADGLWVGVGSDHTDRAAEVHGVALSKQLCRKPMAGALWRFAEVEGHWDRLMLRAWIGHGGEQVLYMEGPLAGSRHPQDLIAEYRGSVGLPTAGPLPVGTVMFTGAMPAIGGIRPADRFEMALEDPVLGRTLSHAYRINALPVVS
jgi:hypothetical protein